MQAVRLVYLRRFMTAQVDIPEFEKIRTGDIRAYEALFRKYYQALVNYGFGLLKDREEAEEMVQQVFVNVWNKREEIVIQSSVQAYLYRAVNNLCMNRIRHLKVRDAHRNEVEYTASRSYEHSAQVLISKELTKKIQESVSRLPEKCREIFEMSRFEGLSYAEIADALGVSVKAVEKHMSKALKTLRHELAEYLPLILLYLGQDWWKG